MYKIQPGDIVRLTSNLEYCGSGGITSNMTVGNLYRVTDHVGNISGIVTIQVGMNIVWVGTNMLKLVENPTPLELVLSCIE